MSISLSLILATALNPPTPEFAKELLSGIFSNEEQVYFAKESGQTPPAWFSMEISPTEGGMTIDEIDAFGVAHPAGHPVKISRDGAMTVLDYGKCQRLYSTEGNALIASGVTGKCAAPATMSRIAPEGITLTFPDGKTSLLRRARPVTCWSAIPKNEKKADGSTDWVFVQNLKIHDQGGKALIGKDPNEARQAVIKMRNVVWPPKADGSPNSNRPSLVLYIFTPDDPDKAVSYSWADPSAKRVGINLRWMQASCTVDSAE